MAELYPETGYAAEVTISNNGYGGDFVLDDSGDLTLSVDTFDTDQATQERITRLLHTNARVSVRGNPVGMPDCEEFPDWGVGLPGRVDDLADSEMQAEVTSGILNGLAADPGIASDPAPSVDYVLDGYTVYVLVTYTRITGRTVTLPSIPLSVSGG